VAEGSLFGREVLRAYGTFPHPNVLGGILSVVLVGLFSARFWGPFVVGLGGVLVSLSRTAWVSLAGGVLGFSLFGRGLGLVILEELSIARRWELLQSAWGMIKSAPLAGVGLGQFVIHLPRFGIPSGLSLFLQPVHNIFALVAAESGIFSAVLLVALFLFALRETIRKKRFLLTVALLQLIFLGMFDHYLYTLPQGLFLFSLIIGLSFSYSGFGEPKVNPDRSA
jgi:O-antigen ligase